MGRDYWETAIRQEMLRSGCSRDEAAHRVNAQVFGGDKADEMKVARAEMSQQEAALEHLNHCAELAPGAWECDPDCPIYRRNMINDRQQRSWKWGTI